MSDNMNMLNQEELENVTGGKKRIVNNESVGYANIRSQPGKKSDVILTLKNGAPVYTTGKTVKKDGYTWYEIFDDEAENGYAWIAGSLIGF